MAKKNYTKENSKAKAITQIINGTISMNTASKIFQTPRSTLHDKLKGRQPMALVYFSSSS